MGSVYVIPDLAIPYIFASEFHVCPVKTAVVDLTTRATVTIRDGYVTRIVLSPITDIPTATLITINRIAASPAVHDASGDRGIGDEFSPANITFTPAN